MPFDRFSGEKMPGRFLNPPDTVLPDGGDMISENIFSVLGRWPETDADWAEVERVMGFMPGQKAGMQSAGYLPGQVMGDRGMMPTPDMGKRR